MKKLSISLLVMLLIASLFTSCSNGSDDASDVRVKVRLTPSGGGRSLSTVTETINLDDDSITWHYSATKVSEKQFNYGATSDSLLPKDGIVTLSQGEWSIGLWGIKDGKKVYAGTIDKTIKWNFYEPNVTVPVPVNKNTGDNGYIVLTDVKIKVGESIITPNYASIDGSVITISNGSYTKIECSPGIHNVTFAYKDGSTVYAEETISVKVESGLETRVIGFIDGTGSSGSGESQTTAMKPIEGGVKANEKVIVESSIVPATTSTPENKTTVTFPAGSFNEDSTNAVLNLSVKSAGSEFSVTSTGSLAPVAGINISLFVNGNEVKEFNGKEVVIETYIAKNLDNVDVKYSGNGNQPTFVSYDKGTGKLVFKTTHFSEYYVLADEVEAYNTNQNKVYKELQAAIGDVNDNETLVLLKDCKYETDGTGLWNIIHSITLDGNGHSISGYGSRSGNKTTLAINNGGSNEVTVVLKNLTINNNGQVGRPIETRGNINSLTLDNVEINATGGGNTQGLTIGGNQSSNANIEIKNSTISVGKAGYSYISFNPATVKIENSTFNGYSSMYFKGKNGSTGSNGTVVNATNSTFESPNAHSIEGNNDFGAFVFEDEGVSINLTNCSINAETMSSAYQAVFQFNSHAERKGDVSVTIDGDQTKVYGVICMDSSGEWNGNITLKDGIYNLTKIDNETDGFKYSDCINENIKVSVNGGAFSVNPTTYVNTNNYNVTNNGSTWIVTAK